MIILLYNILHILYDLQLQNSSFILIDLSPSQYWQQFNINNLDKSNYTQNIFQRSLPYDIQPTHTLKYFCKLKYSKLSTLDIIEEEPDLENFDEDYKIDYLTTSVFISFSCLMWYICLK